MLKKSLLIIIGLVFLVALGGCKVRHGDFTVITNKNIGEIDMTHSENLGMVKGVSKKSIIIFIPTGSPHLEDAVDDALNKSGGDYLTDAAIHYSWWYFPYIYGEMKWIVDGTAWKMER